jgi:hypothetical protein
VILSRHEVQNDDVFAFIHLLAFHAAAAAAAL